ncbi:MAG: hypothetical protein ABIF82_12500 [Planctomycetota bacterium]
MNKEVILAANDLGTVKVPTPEWGDTGHVFVRVMTAAERDAYEDGMFVRDGDKRVLNLKNIRARLCSIVICDESGKRMFTNDEAGALGGKSSVVLDRIYEAARRVNALDENAPKEMAKN